TLIEVLIDEFAENSQCIVSMMDTYYRRKADVNQIIANNYLPMYRVLIRDNEEFAPPRKRLLQILKESKYVGCDVYLIFMANGLQVANFLQYAEEERLISTQGKFLLIYDFRIFHTDMRYLWNRIINVIFLRHYVEFKRHSKSQLLKHEWYDLNTIPFPARTKGLVITKYIDTWYQNRFRYGISHFSTKIDDLKKQKLRVAVFEHLPAVTTDAQSYFKSQKGINANSKPLGIEFEMLLIIANVLNFKPYFYEPHNIKNERWGDIKNGTLTGILGETQKRNAIFYLGDLYYTMRHLELLDLSWPYNTECLTFLTLESLTENSWKLLILPFRLYTWIAVIFTLLAASITFFMFSRFYKYHIVFEKARSRKVEEYSGLYLFTELQNCILYTLSMLLQVSLPLLPSAWSLRILIGWWWIFTILITVTYRASMTASLANSIDRVTIDTIAQLVKSSTVIGSWSDEMKDFFINSSDVNLQRLSNRFIVTMDEQDAIAAVANGTLSYYENVHVLKYERVKRQILEVELQKNDSQENKHKFLEHNLHIMEECVINMPISLGMDKHSPLKGPVDKLIKRIMEAGFVKKWLSDITQQSKILELRQEGTVQKLLVDLDKLQGAVVALGFGYIIGIIALVGEIWYWKYIVLKNPNYNKYRKELFYKKSIKC
ncbi:PREDICTED: glutamate receptor 1, partial [Ceratosolen solmsi marchali]|uniref:Glutamate receptor 1 n=1 Tax=Ceratosolen solmsi marchali TaxID=326594 RepID=A0AAJ6VIE0_9HYME